MILNKIAAFSLFSNAIPGCSNVEIALISNSLVDFFPNIKKRLELFLCFIKSRIYSFKYSSKAFPKLSKGIRRILIRGMSPIWSMYGWLGIYL